MEHVMCSLRVTVAQVRTRFGFLLKPTFLKESSSVSALLGRPDAERSTCLTVEWCLHRCGIVVTCRQVIQSQHRSSRGSGQRESKDWTGFLSL